MFDERCVLQMITVGNKSPLKKECFGTEPELNLKKSVTKDFGKRILTIYLYMYIVVHCLGAELKFKFKTKV